MPVSTPGSRGHERWLKVYHLTGWLYLIIFVLLVVSRLTPKPVWLSWLVTVVALSLMVLTGKAIRVHVFTMCSVCAANMPLDGSQRAQDRRRVLKIFHVMAELILKCRYLIYGALLGSLLFPPVVSVIVFFVVGAAGTIVQILMMVHMPLQLWCPYCHNDDGDEEQVPTPPVPSATKTG